MIVKLSEKAVNKAIDYICKLGELSTDKELYKAINVVLDMADTLKDNDLLDK